MIDSNIKLQILDNLLLIDYQISKINKINIQKVDQIAIYAIESINWDNVRHEIRDFRGKIFTNQINFYNECEEVLTRLNKAMVNIENFKIKNKKLINIINKIYNIIFQLRQLIINDNFNLNNFFLPSEDKDITIYEILDSPQPCDVTQTLIFQDCNKVNEAFNQEELNEVLRNIEEAAPFDNIESINLLTNNVFGECKQSPIVNLPIAKNNKNLFNFSFLNTETVGDAFKETTIPLRRSPPLKISKYSLFQEKKEVVRELAFYCKTLRVQEIDKITKNILCISVKDKENIRYVLNQMIKKDVFFEFFPTTLHVGKLKRCFSHDFETEESKVQYQIKNTPIEDPIEFDIIRTLISRSGKITPGEINNFAKNLINKSDLITEARVLAHIRLILEIMQIQDTFFKPILKVIWDMNDLKISNVYWNYFYSNYRPNNSSIQMRDAEMTLVIDQWRPK